MDIPLAIYDNIVSLRKLKINNMNTNKITHLEKFIVTLNPLQCIQPIIFTEERIRSSLTFSCYAQHILKTMPSLWTELMDNILATLHYLNLQGNLSLLLNHTQKQFQKITENFGAYSTKIKH